MAPTDSELVARCLQQDEYAWQLLVERHSHRILNIAFQFTGRREEAEDLAQEIFLRVFRSLRRFDLNTVFLPWLVRVSRNLCIDEYRSRAREKASLTGDEPDPERTADPGAGPLRSLESREVEGRVRRGLDQLSEELRVALILRDLQGLSYAEIAQSLEVPEGTVKSRIHRARIELAEILSREPGGADSGKMKMMKILDPGERGTSGEPA
ncbi:MAG TPA: RNA polymerase sigma factor [Candidatus Polarisedimenticolia bacterium]|nr:RNA polymerase sigma factor [Candidatus Polarisedimenticolia bacterium]